MFRGLETRTELVTVGSSAQGLVLSCSLLVNLRIGISGWATGDSDPSSRLILRCPRLGLQSEVSDFL